MTPNDSSSRPARIDHQRNVRSSERGGAALEAVLQLLLVLLIVPPLVCYAMQTILMLVGLVIPWFALVLIAFIVTAGVAVIASTQAQGWEPLDASPQDDLPLPPTERPKGIRDDRRNR